MFKTLRYFVLAAFLGFQAAQAFHSHQVNLSDKDCAVCQVVHQTPTLADGIVLSAFYGLFSQRIPIVLDNVVVESTVVRAFAPRAPPAV